MNEHEDRTYKAGYAKGYADAKKNEKHGRWEYDISRYKYFCSACSKDAISFKKITLCDCDCYEVCLSDYCPNCGAIMDLPNITENTRKALDKMGENVHSGIDFDYAAED